MRYNPQKIEGNLNVTDQFPLKELFVLLAGFIGIFIAAYVILGFAVELIMPHIDLKTENKLMKLMNSSASPTKEIAGIPIGLRQKNDRLLENVLRKLISNSSMSLPEIKIRYVNNETINAYAHIDGTIEIHSALFSKMSTENELAFVIAHELGHYAYKDNLKVLGRKLVLLFLGTTFLGADNGLNKMMLNTLGATESKFNQVQEERADKYAIELLNKTYGHIGGANSSFSKILKTNEPEALYVFSTHPNPSKRLETISREINLKGYKVDKQLSLNED
ncbi:MAG: M48 family metallopeptidase [Candidatus Caenarcaniphilales bacterium]|nr:M48 family metallopeptidase [Candidatus Caenarcaniphilales bacterium]